MKEQVKDKRTAIMKAALKLFTERGFHGTSTAQISKEAGVATGTLFNYFDTKEALINGLYIEVKGALSRSMGEDVLSQSTFELKLKKMWSNQVEWGIDNRDEFLFIGQFCSSPYITTSTQEEVMKGYVFLHELMREGIATEEIGDFPVELVISLFYHSGRTVVNLILDSDPREKDRLMEDGFKIIWNGLASV